jgi:hypothetical protein
VTNFLLAPEMCIFLLFKLDVEEYVALQQFSWASYLQVCMRIYLIPLAFFQGDDRRGQWETIVLLRYTIVHIAPPHHGA